MSKWMRKLYSNLPRIEKNLVFFLDYNQVNNCTCNLEGVYFAQLTDQNCDMLINIRKANVVEAFRNMYRNGEFCLGAFLDGELIGHCSMIFPTNRKNQIIINNSGYIHYCYIAPMYRGKNVYPKMLEELMRQAYSLYGIKRFSIITSPDNIASQRGLIKAGFSEKRECVSVIWRKIVVGKVFV